MLAWSADPRAYRERIPSCGTGSGERLVADDGALVEDFGLADNLMLPSGLSAPGWPKTVYILKNGLIVSPLPNGEPMRHAAPES